MRIAMTEAQRCDLAADGFTVLENFLSGEKLERTVAKIEQLRGRVGVKLGCSRWIPNNILTYSRGERGEKCLHCACDFVLLVQS